MNRSIMTVLGVILVLVGLFAFAVPVFTTQHTEDVARVGDLKLQTTQRRSYEIPALVSGGVLLLGVVLIGAAVRQRR